MRAGAEKNAAGDLTAGSRGSSLVRKGGRIAAVPYLKGCCLLRGQQPFVIQWVVSPETKGGLSRCKGLPFMQRTVTFRNVKGHLSHSGDFSTVFLSVRPAFPFRGEDVCDFLDFLPLFQVKTSAFLWMSVLSRYWKVKVKTAFSGEKTDVFS
ncbi:MAG: hypothetical protein NC344_02985 [Bacteroidales bacterium]|nr:hypothetical protein [Bacteroidales bacterium]MCM1146797.1 hypothetical protein [Bacteroidales bacterium]MCM1205706.1 hypothetical protein [Bacillota bacterium]MCM1510764.1 hypothetical protein [Clostridium sp.]